MTKRRTAAEIIAFHFSQDMRDVSECRYKPTVYTTPAIYTLGDDYYCAPSNNKPPKRPAGKWNPIGTHYGRTIFCARLGDLETSD